jgi:hypothetical protein
MVPPLVKSGIVIGWPLPAAKAGNGAARRATRASERREVFISLLF